MSKPPATSKTASIALAALFGAGAMACEPRVGGRVAARPVPLTFTRCESAERYGASGVVLVDRGGVWFVAVEPIGGGAGNVVIGARGRRPEPDPIPDGFGALGPCAQIEITRQWRRVEGRATVRGRVDFACTNGVVSIEGTVDFANCP